MEKLSKTDWWAPLQTAMGPEYWERVAIFLKDVYGHGEVYPALPNVFAALVATSLA
ncbi:MAG: uracil-DNA glycosylase, partial [Weissella confusa]|nr:uracil-DNA glycosylase [Weissella confusa]